MHKFQLEFVRKTKHHICSINLARGDTTKPFKINMICVLEILAWLSNAMIPYRYKVYEISNQNYFYLFPSAMVEIRRNVIEVDAILRDLMIV